MTLDNRPAGPMQTSTLSGRSARVRRGLTFCFSAARGEGDEETGRIVLLRGWEQVGLVRGVRVGRAALRDSGKLEREPRPAESRTAGAMRRLDVRRGIKAFMLPKSPPDNVRSRDDGEEG